MATKKPAEAVEVLAIKPPNMQFIKINISGTAPLCINKFSQKAMIVIAKGQAAGSVAKGKKIREPKDFEALCEGAKHVAEEGWCGIAASSFRNAMISACRTVGYKMVHAKLAVFVEADGFDREDGTPLVKITKGKPEMWIAPARNSNGGMDLRARPLWRSWGATLRIRFDGDMFTATDLLNLIRRVGLQVGIGEGRPDSKMSAGIGYGLFDVESV
jgi:hypothetical protein